MKIKKRKTKKHSVAEAAECLCLDGLRDKNDYLSAFLT